MSSVQRLNDLFREVYTGVWTDAHLPHEEYCAKHRAESDARTMDAICGDALQEDSDRERYRDYIPTECPCCGHVE